MSRVVSEVTATKIRYLPKNIRDYPQTPEGQEELLKDIASLAGKRSMIEKSRKRDENGEPQTTRAKKPAKSKKIEDFELVKFN